MAQPLVPARGQTLRADRLMLDDTAMMKQITATHSPDGRQVDVKSLLHIVEDVLHRSAPTIPSITHEGSLAQLDALEDKALQTDFSGMLELLAFTINNISCEIACKCSSGGDAHATTLALFNTLASYPWEAKAVIAMGAFAVNYGEFWLIAQLYPTNPLAKSVAMIKQLPEILEQAGTLKPKFDALTNLIKPMMDLTKCIIEFGELPSQYIGTDTPEYATANAHIPTAVYWIIRSIVACASQITGLIGMSHGYIAATAEAWELSSLAHKVTNIHNHLKNKLDLCYRHIDEKRYIEAYQMLVRLMETPHIDNMKVLKALICLKEDNLPLYDGSSRKRVNIDILRRKNVLLFISDLDLSNEELFILGQMYQESRNNPSRPESHYEVVWMPVIDRSAPWTETDQKKFESLQHEMPWYSVNHPSLLEPAVIRYIKEVWKFNKKPLLVVLDQQGRVVNPNALHMMWIWGSMAFPFTSQREEALWKEESWRIELLADSIEPLIFQWIADGSYTCLYGGDDIEWIRKFTKIAKDTAPLADISLEMLYVGKSNAREKTRKINNIIKTENLSHILPEPTLTWFFWARLESMWQSKIQHGKSDSEDPIMQEIMTMLSFDGSEQCWAVICRGPNEMARAKADTILESFNKFDEWRDFIPAKGFITALNDNLNDLHTPHHCNRLVLPGAIGTIPEKIVCTECGKSMEKFIMYRCCTD